MLYEGINNAIDNIDSKRIEMATVFNVSKWEQFKNIYLPAATPYLFSSLIAGFGLSFKIAIASQLVQTVITNINPNYPSIGMIIASLLKQNDYAQVIGWGMIAIILSLVMELVIKEIGRICMPFKYKDRNHIINFVKKFKRKPQHA
jgi:ABC-type nitrate/sulfonate/bicarbonate transport system permease component